MSANSTNSEKKILLIGNNTAHLDDIKNIFADMGIAIVSGSSADAVRLAGKNKYILCLLDFDITDTIGTSVARCIRATPFTQSTPIIFLTNQAPTSENDIEGLYASGRIDYLNKPLIPIILKTKVDFFTELFLKTEGGVQLSNEYHNAVSTETVDTEAQLTRSLGDEILKNRTHENERKNEEQPKTKIITTNEVLNEKDEKLRLILDNMKDYAFIILDPDGNILEWGGGAEHITGWRTRDISGRKIEIIFTAADLAKSQAEQERVIAKTTGRSEDRRWHVRKDGSRFYADGVMVPLKNDEGELLGLAKIFRDATTEHQTAIALRVSEEKFSLLVNSAGTGFLGVGSDLTCTFINAAGADMLGYEPAELIGRNIHDIIMHKDGEPVVSSITEYLAVVQCKINIEGEAFTHRNGTPVPVSYQISPMVVDGVNNGAVITFNDVAERRKNEEALRNARIQLEANLSAGEVATWIYDIPSNKVTADRNLARLFSVSPEVADGAPLEEYLKAIHEEDIRGFTALVKDSIASGKPFRANYRIRGSGGDYRHVFARGKVEMEDGKAIRLAGVVVDVTQQKQIEQQLQAREEKLQQLTADLSEANRRKTEFLATLAHELRNPLAPIRTGLNIMQLAPDDFEMVANTRNMMERQVNQMVRIVDDLLDLARITSNKMDLKKQQVALKTIISNAVETATPLVDNKHHILKILLPDEHIELYVDPTRIAQVIGNLLLNAAKYTPDYGSITLSAYREEEDVVIVVSDNGQGISPAELPNIFEMFSQARGNILRAGSGLGVGLSLVHRIVELHNGKITVSSDGLNKGSAFTLKLRAINIGVNGDRILPEQDDQMTSNEKSETLKVVVVDDNADAAASLASLVELFGHNSRTALNGKDAIALVEQYKPDVAFVDIGMPLMNGYEVASALRKIPGMESVELIALTGWGTESDRARSQAAGFNRHLTKPIDIPTLKKVLTPEPAA